MPRFPTQTFQMGEASFRSPTLELISRDISKTESAVSVVTEFVTLAVDRLFILTNISGKVEPGATQDTTGLIVQGFTGAGAPFNIFRLVFPGTTDLDEAFNWQGEVMMRGRGREMPTLRATAAFNSGVAANQLEFFFSGYIIPRANVAEY